MALANNALWRTLRTTVGIRFTRFIRVAIASLAASELTLVLCDGVFHLTAVPAAVTSWFTGAVVSYLLSRWAWERKGKPNVLRETVPFWAISAVVVVVLTASTKLGYYIATHLHLHGPKHTAFVALVYLVANFITFMMRFIIFHYVLFAEPKTATPPAAPGPDAADGNAVDDMLDRERVGRP
jgi:putative flippase GtrA